MKLSRCLLFVLVVFAAIALFCIISDNADAASVTWKQTSGALASNANNWENGSAPTTGDVVYFTSLSTSACTWDVTATINSMVIKSTYSGTITGSSALNIGAGGWYQAGGTFTFAATLYVTDAGNFVKSGGTLTNSINVIMTGAGTSFTCNQAINRLEINAAVTITATTGTGGAANAGLVIGASGVASLNAGVTIDNILYFSGSYSNAGRIVGGTVVIKLYDASKSLSLGDIESSVIIQVESGAAAGRILTLTASNIASMTTLTVRSLDATQTCTLNLAGYNLAITNGVVGTRGVVLGSGGISASGNFDSYNGTTSGSWSLTMTGTSSPYIKTPAANTINGLTFTTTNLRLASSLNVTKTFYVGGTYTLGTKTITVGTGTNVTVTAGNSWSMMANRYWGKVNITGTLTTTGGTYSLWCNGTSSVNGTVTNLVILHANAFFTFRGSVGYLYLETAYRTTFFANGTASYIVWNTTGQWTFRPNVAVYPGYVISKSNMYYVEPTGGYYIYITRFDTSILYQMQVTHWGNESWEFNVKNLGTSTTLFTYNLFVPDLDDTEVIVHIDDAAQEVYAISHGAITFTSSIAPGVTHIYLLVSNDAVVAADTTVQDMTALALALIFAFGFTGLAFWQNRVPALMPIASLIWVAESYFVLLDYGQLYVYIGVAFGLMLLFLGVERFLK